jgi:hypothetical protein
VEYAGRLSREYVLDRERTFADRLLAAQHPAFGLGASWTGPRSVGDVHFVGDTLESVGLVHGDPMDEAAAQVQVHTTQLPTDQLDALMPRRTELFPYGSPPAPPFEPLGPELDVGGQLLVAVGVTAGDGWLVRVAPEPGVTVYVEGQRFSLDAFARDHALVAVDDLTPYLDGRLAWIRRNLG